MMFYYKTHCKIIVYAPGHVFPFVLSLPLSLSGAVLLWESRCCRPNYHTAESTKRKNFTPSMTPPSPRLIFPLLSPIKSLNDSHASDTPPSFGFFLFCFFFTVSIKLQVREIHRHAYKYSWCDRLRPLSALSEIFFIFSST